MFNKVQNEKRLEEYCSLIDRLNNSDKIISSNNSKIRKDIEKLKDEIIQLRLNHHEFMEKWHEERAAISKIVYERFLDLSKT